MSQDKRSVIKNLIKNKNVLVLVAFAVLVIFLFIYIFKPFEKSAFELEQRKKDRQAILTLYNSGKIKEVLPKIEAFKENYETNTEINTLLASSYWLLGKRKEALTVYKEILEKDSSDADTLYRTGLLYRQLGDSNQSFANLKKAVEVKPKNSLFKSELAKAYEFDKQYKKAIKQWQEVLKLVPQKTDYRASIWESIGSDYQLMGKLKEAKAAYKNALKYSPNSTGIKEKLSRLNDN